MHRFHSFGAAVMLVAAAAAQAQAPTAAGEVVKIDKPGLRLTLKHGGLKHLDMPAMTLSFRVREAQLLNDLAVGDRVRFVAERIDGHFTVTQVFKAPS